MTWIVWTCQVQHFNPATDSDPMGWISWHLEGKSGLPCSHQTPTSGGNGFQWHEFQSWYCGGVGAKIRAMFSKVSVPNTRESTSGTRKNLFSPQNWRCEVGLLKPPLSHLPSFVTDVWEASGNGVISSSCKNMQKHAKTTVSEFHQERVSSGHCIWSFWWTCWEKKLLKSPNNAPPDRGPGHGPCDFFSALGTTTGLQKFWIKVWGLEKKD